MINHENIGKYIKQFRKERKISQEQMATDLGMYQADISNLESGKKGSGIQDMDRIEMIANYLGIPFLELIAVGVENEEKQMIYYKNYLLYEGISENPDVYMDFDDSAEKVEILLEELSKGIKDMDNYKKWKEDYITCKIETIHKNHQKMITCNYLFAGIGWYKETMPKEDLEGFKCWIEHNGSAFLGSCQEATEEEIRNYACQSIIDELIETDDLKTIDDLKYGLQNI